MHIVEKNDKILQIADQNRQCLWGLLFATPFIAVGLIVTAATAKVVSLECQRAPNQQIHCQRTITGLLGTEKDQIPEKLQTASTVRTSGIGIMLNTTNGTVPLAPYRTFVTKGHYQNTDRINAFLKNPQQITLKIEQDDRWSNGLWSGNFLIGGLIVALSSLSIPAQSRYIFDRTRNEVTLRKKYWLCGDRQTVLPLSAIQQAQVVKLPFSYNRQPLYLLKLDTLNAPKISFSVPSRDEDQYQSIANTINRFIRHT